MRISNLRSGKPSGNPLTILHLKFTIDKYIESMVLFRVLSRTNLAGSSPSTSFTSSISFTSFRLRTLFLSLRSFLDSRPLFSITSALFLQNTRGGIPLRDLVRRTEAQKCLSVTPLFATLTHSVSRKSFPCHSYANTRDGGATLAPVSASASLCLESAGCPNRFSLFPVSRLLHPASRSRAGVELERRPVEGFAEDGVGVQQRKLGGAQGCRGILPLAQFGVELVHELRGGGVVHFPQRGDDVVGAGAEECPGKSDQAFSGVGARAGASAGGDGHEVRRQRMRDDVAGVEFEGIAVRTQNHRGIQGMRAAGAPVRDKVQIRKPLRPTLQESGGRGLRSRKHFAARIAEIAADTIHFGGRLPQYGKIVARRDGVPDQQQIPVLRSAVRARPEQSERTGGAERYVLDPKMPLRPRDEQSLEIQSVQTAIRQQNHPRARRNQLRGWLDQQRVQLLPFRTAAGQHVAPAQHRFAVRLDQRINFRRASQRQATHLRRCDDPQIRLFLPQPIEQQNRLRALRDLPRLKIAKRKRESLRRGAKPLGQSPRAAQLRHLQSIFRAMPRNQECDVVIVEGNRAGEKRQPQILRLHRRPHAFDSRQRMPKLLFRPFVVLFLGVNPRQPRLRLPALRCVGLGITNKLLEAFLGLSKIMLGLRDASSNQQRFLHSRLVQSRPLNPRCFCVVVLRRLALAGFQCNFGKIVQVLDGDRFVILLARQVQSLRQNVFGCVIVVLQVVDRRDARQPVQAISNQAVSLGNFFCLLVKQKSILKISQFSVAPSHVSQGLRFTRVCSQSLGQLEGGLVPIDSFIVAVLTHGNQPEASQRVSLQERQVLLAPNCQRVAKSGLRFFVLLPVKLQNAARLHDVAQKGGLR